MIKQLLRLISLHGTANRGNKSRLSSFVDLLFVSSTLPKICSWNFSFGVSYFESIVYSKKRFNSHAVQQLVDQVNAYWSRNQLIRSLLCSITFAHFSFLRSFLSSVLRYTYTHLLSAFNSYFNRFEYNTVWCTRWRILEAVRSHFINFPFIDLVLIGCRFTNTLSIDHPQFLNPAALNRKTVSFIKSNLHSISEKFERNDSHLLVESDVY